MKSLQSLQGRWDRDSPARELFYLGWLPFHSVNQPDSRLPRDALIFFDLPSVSLYVVSQLGWRCMAPDYYCTGATDEPMTRTLCPTPRCYLCRQIS